MLKTDFLNKNGKPFELHSGNILASKPVGKGVREEYYLDHETGEVVVLETWFVTDGDCVSSQFEVKEVISSEELFGKININ